MSEDKENACSKRSEGLDLESAIIVSLTGFFAFSLVISSLFWGLSPDLAFGCMFAWIFLCVGCLGLYEIIKAISRRK